MMMGCKKESRGEGLCCREIQSGPRTTRHPSQSMSLDGLPDPVGLAGASRAPVWLGVWRCSQLSPLSILAQDGRDRDATPWSAT